VGKLIDKRKKSVKLRGVLTSEGIPYFILSKIIHTDSPVAREKKSHLRREVIGILLWIVLASR
jgi:hypothetical protein